jgi:hypothetical protein
MFKNNQKGFIDPTFIIFLMVAFLVGGFLYWNINRADDEPVADSNIATEVADQGADQAFVLKEDPLPEDWVVDENSPNMILLSSTTNDCFVEATFTTDTNESNSPDVDQVQQVIDAVESKGYTVEEQMAGTMTVNTSDGQKELESQVLKLSGSEGAMFQNYYFDLNESSFTKIVLSCPAEVEYPSAEKALLSIEFTPKS